MRVLVLSWEYPPVIEGGLGRHVRNLSKRLAADGARVHVLTRGVGTIDADGEHRGVSVHRITSAAFPRELDAFLEWVAELNLEMVRRGAELCEELGFDLVHSHDWLVADAGRQLSSGYSLPWVVTVHATEHGRHGGWVQQPPQSYIHAAERAMARGADHLITCSDYMATHVSEAFGVPRRRITTIPNGIDPAELVSLPQEDLPALRARYAQPNERLVLMVGRLAHEKGFHLALEALAPLVKRPGAVRFVIAGSGMAEADLKAQATRLGLDPYGSFIGWADDALLPSLYRVADVSIVPSLYEPFGLVALEAMASGCVCVVADTGGLREVVPDDGVVAIRFRSGDVKALRSVLRQLLADDAPRAEIAARARAHALQFSWQRSAQLTMEVYGALVSGRRRSGTDRVAQLGPPRSARPPGDERINLRS